MRKLLIVAFIAAAFLLPLPQVMACATGGDNVTPINRMVEYADLVVSGRIEFVDKLRGNYVLEVDRYFKGDGDKFLSIVNWRPAVYFADTVRDYDHGCLSFSPGRSRTRRDDVGYFALKANGDGTYGFYYGSVWIPGDVAHWRELESTEGLVEFVRPWQSEIELESPAPVAAFEALLMQLAGKEKTTEPEGDDYPLPRFLNITTQSGKRYRLNPDRSVTWLDPARWPIAISNDGSHVMYRLERDELGFQYLALVKKELHWCPYCQPLGSSTVGGGRALSVTGYSHDGWLEPVKGWFAQFSPDSNFVAVQDRNELLVYMFNNWTMEEYGYGRLMGMEVVAGQRVWWDPTFYQEPMAWSADSSTIAYQDSRGIWHWDLFEETHPLLVLADPEGEKLLDISRSGRFLRYSHGETWILLDVETGDSHERAIATPDERNVIQLLPSAPSHRSGGFSGKRESTVSRWRSCQAPLSNCRARIEYPDTLIEYFEFQPGWIGLVSQDSVQVFPWYLSMQESHLSIMISPPAAIQAFDFDSLL